MVNNSPGTRRKDEKTIFDGYMRSLPWIGCILGRFLGGVMPWFSLTQRYSPAVCFAPTVFDQMFCTKTATKRRLSMNNASGEVVDWIPTGQGLETPGYRS
jgi:hypothetical protein